VRLRELADTREGRLTIIVVVGGSLLVTTAFANVWLANAADDQADRIRSALRRDLAVVSDEQLAAYPETLPAIEEAAQGALIDAEEGGRLVRIDQPDRDEVVVAVESGLGWQRRCVEAELRGDATVITAHQPGPC
jgi:hypothetical protein